MWVAPKTTLGGAGMWEDVRSNGIIELQRYKVEGTAFEGLFTSFRKIYSDAPNYRIIVSNSPYWEFANGHHQEGLETLFDWMCQNVIAKLTAYNIAGYVEGDTDRKIRIVTDFMRAFVIVYGVLHKTDLTDQEFNKVIVQMTEQSRNTNMPYTAVVMPQSSSPVPGSAPAAPRIVAQAVSPLPPPPTVVASQPVTVSQLVTAYEKDPYTGQLRKVQVYRPVPVQQPMYYQQPTGPVYAAPSSAHQYPAQRGYPAAYGGQSSGHHVAPPPQNKPYTQVYQIPSSQAPSQAPNPYGHHQLQQPQRSASSPSGYPGHSSATAPQQPQQHRQQGYVANPYPPPSANPYSAPPPASNPYHNRPSSVLPPPDSDIPVHLPIDQWDAQKPDRSSSASGHYTQSNPPPPPQMVSPPTSSASAPNLAAPVPLDTSYSVPLVASPSENPFTSLSSSQSSVGSSSISAPLAAEPTAPAAATPGNDEDKNVCKICFERDLDCALLPCSHVTCYQCATSLKLTKCPFCRQDIAQVLKLYRA